MLVCARYIQACVHLYVQQQMGASNMLGIPVVIVRCSGFACLAVETHKGGLCYMHHLRDKYLLRLNTPKVPASPTYTAMYR